jgi:hypothetical protein
MSANPIALVFSMMMILLISGFADSQGFTHAAEIWRGNRFSLVALLKSASGFATGISLYWCSLRYMNKLGIVEAEIQTVMWFSITLIGVAVSSGRFARWPLSEQLVALGIVLGLAWLMFRSNVTA